MNACAYILILRGFRRRSLTKLDYSLQFYITLSEIDLFSNFMILVYCIGSKSNFRFFNSQFLID